MQQCAHEQSEARLQLDLTHSFIAKTTHTHANGHIQARSAGQHKTPSSSTTDTSGNYVLHHLRQVDPEGQEEGRGSVTSRKQRCLKGRA